MRTKTLNDDTYATDPGGVNLSLPKLFELQPELTSSFTWAKALLRDKELRGQSRQFWLDHIAEHLQHGDSRAAMVVNEEPLIVAAYTDELDCVVHLQFPSMLRERYSLTRGRRLLTVNTYRRKGQRYPPDIVSGDRLIDRWGNYSPYIAEFLSNDFDAIETRKSQITEDEWVRTKGMAIAYLRRWGLIARDGRPLNCMSPAAVLAIPRQ